MTTLLTRQEVIDYAEYRDTFPPTAIKLISEVEEWEFNNKLGYDFYQQMIADLTDLSIATKYTTGTYNLGQIVIYNQKYYTPTKNAVTSQPPTIADWKEAQKFASECFNSLWCNYLARYLSLAVIQRHKPTALLSMASGYLVQPLNGDFTAPTKAAIDTDIRGIEALKNIAFDNLDKYINRVMLGNDTTLKDCYGKYKGVESNTNCSCGEIEVNNKKRLKWA